jgi:hypothetical protein
MQTKTTQAMVNMRKKLAELICHGDAILNPKKWLDQEVCYEALNIPNLDEFPSQAILPLAKLVANGESDARKLALATDIDESKVDEYLEALCEFKFAEKTSNGYKSTRLIHQKGWRVTGKEG